MNKLAGIKLTEKNSQFFSYLYSIDNPDEINHILKEHRKKYKKANHHCYALLYNKDNTFKEMAKDDGEVGHPGRVLLTLLEKYNLNHHVLIVSRIFGGIKLGVGGVSRAFKESGELVLTQYQKTK